MFRRRGGSRARQGPAAETSAVLRAPIRPVRPGWPRPASGGLGPRPVRASPAPSGHRAPRPSRAGSAYRRGGPARRPARGSPGGRRLRASARPRPGPLRLAWLGGSRRLALRPPSGALRPALCRVGRAWPSSGRALRSRRRPGSPSPRPGPVGRGPASPSRAPCAPVGGGGPMGRLWRLSPPTGAKDRGLAHLPDPVKGTMRSILPALFAAFFRKRPLTVSYRCATMILPGPLRGRRPPGRFWPRPSRDVHGGRFFSTCSRSLRPPPPALPPPGEGGAGSSAHPPGVQTPATGGDEKTWTETPSVQVNKTSIYFVDLFIEIQCRPPGGFFYDLMSTK